MALATQTKADPKAVAVARAVYDAVALDSVILFGSRARGDYRPDSDIDLMLIHDAPLSRDDYYKAGDAAYDAIEETFGKRGVVGVDLLLMSKSKYNQCRGGINHVAAQAARDGVDMNGEKPEYEPDPESFDWGDINQRVINTDRELITLEGLIESNLPQEAIGFHAQQANENILKAWISAVGLEYINTHDLEELLGIIKSVPDELVTPAGVELRWLTEYTVKYRYQGAALVMDDPQMLFRMIDDAVAAIYERIKALTGVDELPRYTPPEQQRGDGE
ncbi:MAG: nucleotidyltransferase domain-containing protein [Chloroflexi bacterium]|nr:nucleotidyltransferase domain-containing protein [Chloroflexota bacterium]